MTGNRTESDTQRVRPELGVAVSHLTVSLVTFSGTSMLNCVFWAAVCLMGRRVLPDSDVGLAEGIPRHSSRPLDREGTADGSARLGVWHLPGPQNARAATRGSRAEGASVCSAPAPLPGAEAAVSLARGVSV